MTQVHSRIARMCLIGQESLPSSCQRPSLAWTTMPTKTLGIFLRRDREAAVMSDDRPRQVLDAQSTRLVSVR